MHSKVVPSIKPVRIFHICFICLIVQHNSSKLISGNKRYLFCIACVENPFPNPFFISFLSLSMYI